MNLIIEVSGRNLSIPKGTYSFGIVNEILLIYQNIDGQSTFYLVGKKARGKVRD